MELQNIWQNLLTGSTWDGHKYTVKLYRFNQWSTRSDPQSHKRTLFSLEICFVLLDFVKYGAYVRTSCVKTMITTGHVVVGRPSGSIIQLTPLPTGYCKPALVEMNKIHFESRIYCANECKQRFKRSFCSYIWSTLVDEQPQQLRPMDKRKKKDFKTCRVKKSGSIPTKVGLLPI